MRVLWPLILALSLPAGAAPAVEAELVAFAPARLDPRPPLEFRRKAGELAQWIAEHSDFEPMRQHPSYLFISKDELQYVFYQGGETGYSGEESATVEAMYTHGIMFLQEGFDPERDAAILLHELVHHLQYEQDRKYPCIGAAEVPAYRLQNEYVRETGNGEATDPFWIALVGQCNSPW